MVQNDPLSFQQQVIFSSNLLETFRSGRSIRDTGEWVIPTVFLGQEGIYHFSMLLSQTRRQKEIEEYKNKHKHTLYWFFVKNA